MEVAAVCDCVYTSNSIYVISTEPAEKESSFHFICVETTTQAVEICSRSHLIHSENLTSGLPDFEWRSDCSPRVWFCSDGPTLC